MGKIDYLGANRFVSKVFAQIFSWLLIYCPQLPLKARKWRVERLNRGFSGTNYLPARQISKREDDSDVHIVCSEAASCCFGEKILRRHPNISV
jgi:hypothetical protein